MNSIQNIIYEKINDKYAYGQYSDFKIIIMIENGYINATKLCQLGGKQMKHWNENKQSSELQLQLSTDVGLPTSDLIITLKGGNDKNNQGTYVHPLLIPHIASWISPQFAIKVSRIVNNFIIKEYTDQIKLKNILLEQKEDKIDKLIRQNEKTQQQNDKLIQQNEKTSQQNDNLLKINLDQTSKLTTMEKLLNRINRNVEKRIPSSIFNLNELEKKNQDGIFVVSLNQNKDQVKIFRGQQSSFTKKFKQLQISHPNANTKNIYFKNHIGIKHIYKDIIKKKLINNIPDQSVNIINEQFDKVIQVIEKAFENYQSNQYDHIIDDELDSEEDTIENTNENTNEEENNYFDATKKEERKKVVKIKNLNININVNNTNNINNYYQQHKQEIKKLLNYKPQQLKFTNF